MQKGAIMYSEINGQMKQAQEGIRRLQKIESMLKQLESDRKVLNGKLSEQKSIMEKEVLEAEKFESTSISTVFYSILGNLDERAKKERGEALAAKLKYDQTARDLESLKDHISELNSERLNYAGCEKEYARLFEAKKDILLKESGDAAAKILELTEGLNIAGTRLKELQEAIAAGNNVLDSLDRVYDSLDSAAGWGTWDILGGGLITDLVKHSRIDDANSEVINAQRLLSRFKTELADISINGDMISIDQNSFLCFADFFFDGLIADWMMQTKIKESLEQVSIMRNQVLNTIEGLTSMESRENDDVKKFEAEISELVNREQ
jgi:hypothetical protein